MSEPSAWGAQNQPYLRQALDQLKETLNQRSADSAAGPDEQRPRDQQPAAEVAWTSQRPPALEMLAKAFGLSRFERTLLLLCAGVELDDGLARRCGKLQGDPELRTVSFGFALSVLPGAHWSALAGASPLRHFKLLELLAGPTLTASPLRIPERVLHYLMGIESIDPLLAGVLEPLTGDELLVPSHELIVQQLSEAWCQPDGPALVQLCGADRAAKRAIFQAACQALHLNPMRLRTRALPSIPLEIDALRRVLAREAILSASALFIDCEDGAPDAACLVELLEASTQPLVVALRDRDTRLGHQPITLDVARPTAREQGDVWRETLAPLSTHWNGQVSSLIGQFTMAASDIRDIAQRAVSLYKDREPAGAGVTHAAEYAWAACRARGRPHLEDHAQRIVPHATWSDLVLPASEQQLLRDIVAHARARHRVHHEWGFEGRSARGLSLTALFSGPSGTGKTMAAEVLANELKLDLYCIDLSQVVSKYIGETEKNLRRIFDAAEGGGAVLLFDEADALFGKRSEVKDSHDRYANIEVSYLLQRMEAYRGVAVLTTNMKDALDNAFLRRIRFMVQFPFPNVADREEIWRRVFPSDTPLDPLNHQQLAMLNIAGGNIRNIAVYAAFLAADEGAAVSMKHLLRAARVELGKLERTLSESDVRGWA